ncbi:MAG: PQQ-dependent sugar dehydrogenase, partial [Thermomicrobiales bacterium]|nr:PQQ-dependent sugar dehydrogenase [Thermomicrobiales bacterium]
MPLALEEVATGFAKPTQIANAGDGSNRLFIVEKPGVINIIRDGVVLPEPFLDINRLVKTAGNEQGLLGLAFHPEYASNGRFVVDYTDNQGDVTIARYQVAADNPDRADPESGEVLLVIDKPYDDHNGGMLAFGPDGYLYIGVGDG